MDVPLWVWAAVLGVIAHVALWFVMHLFFADVATRSIGWARPPAGAGR